MTTRQIFSADKDNRRKQQRAKLQQICKLKMTGSSISFWIPFEVGTMKIHGFDWLFKFLPNIFSGLLATRISTFPRCTIKMVPSFHPTTTKYCQKSVLCILTKYLRHLFGRVLLLSVPCLWKYESFLWLSAHWAGAAPEYRCPPTSARTHRLLWLRRNTPKVGSEI